MNDIPEAYLTNETLLAHSKWVKELLDCRRIPKVFRRHPNFEDEEVKAYLLQSNVSPLVNGKPDWEIFSIDRYPRMSCVVSPLPPEIATIDAEEEGACFAEVLQHVAHTNFSNLWREAFNRFSSAWNVRQTELGPVYGMEWDRALIELLARIHQCPVIETEAENVDQKFSSKRFSLVEVERSTPSHVASGLAIIVTSQEIFVVRRFSFCSVLQAITFTPIIFEDSYLKPLFIVYQMISATKTLHLRGVTIGDVSLNDVFVDENNLVHLRPKVLSNLRVIKVADFEKSNFFRQTSGIGFDSTMSPMSKELLQSLKNSTSENPEKTKILSENFLGSIVKLWASGNLSNFDYIMLLNYLCGRTFNNPNHYPVLPWVRDFTSHVGGWRDLSKSKYRLNKGDTQLDLTYDNVPIHQDKDILTQPSFPHHVSDVLSEITYYVYKARRTPKSVLCRHVRSRWVPAEYPSSMQRLQEWTPDESIPDFFTDPSIFSSTHPDLPDLGLPAWCSNAEEFINWHRASLESDQVSERLNSWIDLTFGYKLSGSSAIRAKNVCLPLVDNHQDLRISGVVQIFNQPHPARKTNTSWWRSVAPSRLDVVFMNQQSNEGDSDSLNGEDVPDLSGPTNSVLPSIILPKDYDSVQPINDLESINNFAMKSNSATSLDSEDDSNCDSAKVALSDLQSRQVRDMQVIGCLLAEIFLPKKFLALGRYASLKSRYEVCLSLLRPDQIGCVPPPIRVFVKEVIQQLLIPGPEFVLENFDGYQTVSADGRPLPTPGQCLSPLLSSFAFPKYFSSFARLLRQLDDIDLTLTETRRSDPEKFIENSWTIMTTVAEMKVKLVAAVLAQVADQDLKTEDLDLILPCVKRLFKDQNTSVMAAWHLIMPVSKILGPGLSAQHFLEPILRIYENADPTAKHLKLYHRSFLLTLIVCFGTKTFLKYFTENLIEAVGGYKDFDHQPPTGDEREGLVRNWSSTDENEVTMETNPEPKPGMSSSIEEFAEGEVFAFEDGYGGGDGLDSRLEDLDFDLERPNHNEFGPIYVPSSYDDLMELWLDLSKLNCGQSSGKTRPDGNISQIAAESVQWLAHRLGPVLTAKYLSKNLLKMLNLCYIGPKSYTPVANDLKHPDSQIRISAKRTEGDALADNVLDCLRELACLYGEQFILLQYLPYAWDMVSSCKGKKTIGCNVEGGLLGCLSMVRHCITCLSDTVLMNELSDSENLLSRIFNPVLDLITSSCVVFSGGSQQRQLLAYKLLDSVYMIGLRIGEEMARAILTDLCTEFFSAFDKVHSQAIDDHLEHSSGSSILKANAAGCQLNQVLTPDLAYAAYVTFFHLMGRAHLDSSILNLNLLRRLCLPFNERNTIRVATFAHFRTANQQQQVDLSPGGSSSGNKIGVISSSYRNSKELPDLNGLIKKEISSTSRHLRGTWLAYWEHEIGKDGKTGFDLKQIRLQTFSGHSAGVRYLHVLDNENSFLSGSRDKTVKVWSLRNRGDGSDTLTSQWTYSLHKKSINGLTFLDGLRLAASCDSSIHIWDPFVGSGVHQIDGSATGRLGGPVTVMTTMTPSSSCLILAATQHDGLLHLIDCRVGQVVTDLKVCIGSAGLVRCLCAHSGDPFTVTVGHSSGYISQLDVRTGKLKQAWKAHDGEILTLTPIRSVDFVSTSLDQTVSVWFGQGGEGVDGKSRGNLPGPQEPIHCVAVNGDEVLTGSTANRIVVRRNSTLDSDLSAFSSNRLRPDILKGNLMSMKLVPMNRLLLLGTDTGSIRLVC